MIRMLYVGGPTASEKGAVGTHTAGVISALDRHPKMEMAGVFYDNALPIVVPDQSFFYKVPKSIARLGKFGKLISLFFYTLFIRRAANLAGAEYIYVRFDPFFCFFCSLIVGSKKIIIEYNDLFMDQIIFSAERGQWGEGFSRKIRLSKFYRKFILLSERMTFSRAQLVVAVTESLLDYCKNVGDDVNGIVIKNATDLKTEKSDSAYEKEDDLLRLAHVGTLTYWDGLDELLQSIRMAYEKSSGFKCELVVIGDGKMKSELLRAASDLKIEDSVVIHAPMPRDQALEYLKSSDVVPILKTIVGYGLSPMKFYEAMGAGCHILASDVPHMNEEDDQFVTNVAFPLNIDEISDQLLSLQNRLPEIRHSRKAVRRYAQLNHSWDTRMQTMIDQLEANR